MIANILLKARAVAQCGSEPSRLQANKQIASAPEALAALNGGVLALMDWFGVFNVASQTRHF